jgi:hypothetical protein
VGIVAAMLASSQGVGDVYSLGAMFWLWEKFEAEKAMRWFEDDRPASPLVDKQGNGRLRPSAPITVSPREIESYETARCMDFRR